MADPLESLGITDTADREGAESLRIHEKNRKRLLKMRDDAKKSQLSSWERRMKELGYTTDATLTAYKKGEDGELTEVNTFAQWQEGIFPKEEEHKPNIIKTGNAAKAEELQNTLPKRNPQLNSDSKEGGGGNYPADYNKTEEIQFKKAKKWQQEKAPASFEQQLAANLQDVPQRSFGARDTATINSLKAQGFKNADKIDKSVLRDLRIGHAWVTKSGSIRTNPSRGPSLLIKK